MNKALFELLEEKVGQNGGLWERGLAEIIQSVALLGLSRSNFFNMAAFYGGTALRLLHGLDRFSEDLDFSLLTENSDFHLHDYFGCIAAELKSFGFTAEVMGKEKRFESTTESAFIKENTVTLLISIGVPADLITRFHQSSLTKVKIEVDVNPPGGANTVFEYVYDPVPFSLRSYDLPSLFAGKLHAVLARAWGNRVKGRDWYDFVFYVRKGIPLSLGHLEARLRQTGHFTETVALSPERLRNLLLGRISTVDFVSARRDVERFIPRPQDLNVWDKEFFSSLADRIKFS